MHRAHQLASGTRSYPDPCRDPAPLLLRVRRSSHLQAQASRQVPANRPHSPTPGPAPPQGLAWVPSPEEAPHPVRAPLQWPLLDLVPVAAPALWGGGGSTERAPRVSGSTGTPTPVVWAPVGLGSGPTYKAEGKGTLFLSHKQPFTGWAGATHSYSLIVPRAADNRGFIPSKSHFPLDWMEPLSRRRGSPTPCPQPPLGGPAGS